MVRILVVATAQKIKQRIKKILSVCPLVLEVHWTVKYFILRSRPIPYQAEFRDAMQWLKRLEGHFPKRPEPQNRRLLVFCTLDNWMAMILAITVVLVGKGIQVDFVWYQSLHEVPDLMRRKFERWAAFFRPNQVNRNSRLRLINVRLAPKIAGGDYHLSLAKQAALLDVKILMRCENLRIDDDPEVRKLFDFRVESELDFILRFHSILSSQQYSGVFMHNGRQFEKNAAFQLAKSLGIPRITIEESEREGFVIVAEEEPCCLFPTESLWNKISLTEMTQSKREKVQFRLAERAKTGLEGKYIFDLQTSPREKPANIFERLHIDPGLNIALLCTNVAWDTSCIDRGRAFSTMADWIQQTLSLFIQKPDWQLIIRCHPGERLMGTNESVNDIIKQKWDSLPNNICVVQATDPVNTYSLMPLCKLGLTYVSTVGLEMSAMGVPVVVAGKAHYGQKGFTWDPKSPDEYQETVERILSGNIGKLSSDQIDRARHYFYMITEMWPVSFPWHPSTLKDSMQDWTIEKVLSPKGEEIFGKSFDFLAGASSAV